jgi:hypothetical protein
VFDREGATFARNEWGIENSWIFFEFRRAYINLKRSDGVFSLRKADMWDLSSDLFLVGLSFDVIL